MLLLQLVVHQSCSTRHSFLEGDTLEFTLSKLTKGRRNGCASLKVNFDRFYADNCLCVVQAVRDYLTRTKTWRERKDVDRNQLLLSFVEPHKSVVSCTVAVWLVKYLAESGRDTAVFKAHSTRGASASQASAMGLSCKKIMAMACWKRESTFKTHYLRETAGINSSGSYQKAVFSFGGKFLLIKNSLNEIICFALNNTSLYLIFLIARWNLKTSYVHAMKLWFHEQIKI